VYDKAYDELMNLYLDNFRSSITDLFLDSTVVPNSNLPNNLTSFCFKFKNKLSMKHNIICDNNNIVYKYLTTSSQPPDSVFIEQTIDKLPRKLLDIYTYNKSCTSHCDAGYIICKDINVKLRKSKHMTINAQYRKNMVKNKRENK